jgi:hypothetical protein
MEKLSILKVIRERLYDYKYLLADFDYNVFVKTVANEITDELEENKDV